MQCLWQLEVAKLSLIKFCIIGPTGMLLPCLMAHCGIAPGGRHTHNKLKSPSKLHTGLRLAKPCARS